MATPAQILALAAYAAARRNFLSAERALLETQAAQVELDRQLAAALARGDQAAIDALEKQRTVIDQRARDAAQARNKFRAALTQAQSDALAGGAGFDLISGRHPLLLLPVRLEARFAWLDGPHPTFSPNPALEKVLLVRVYPDEIHEDSHDPALTAAEIDALNEFHKRLLIVRDLRPLQEAWITLASRVGPLRAGWVGNVAISQLRPDRRPNSFSRPSIARALPDCWVAVAELDDGSTLTATSSPVQDPLETGPSPDALSWATDFRAAQNAGMALVLHNFPAGVELIRRLRVVGVRGTLSPADSQQELETLFRAHQYTRGLELLAPGTPTNSLPGARVAYTSRPTPADIVEVNQRRYLIGGSSAPLCRGGDNTDGSALASSLGVNIAAFAFVKRADGTDQADAAHLRSLLTMATERSLRRHFQGIPNPNTLRDLLDFGAARVSALGPVPTLRVGTQPYGILPILRRDLARQAAGSSASRYLPALERLRSSWETATASVERVGRPGADPGETLIRILQQDGVAQRVAFRPYLSRDLAAQANGALTARENLDIARRRDQVLGLLNTFGVPANAKSPLIGALHFAIAPQLTASLVQPAGELAANSAQLAKNFLELAASLHVDELYRHEYPNNDHPDSLLFSLARLAVLEQADAVIRTVLTAAGKNPAHWDDEELPSQFIDFYASMQRRLESPDPRYPGSTFAFSLSEQGNDPNSLFTVRALLRALKTRPADLLEELLRASLGLFSHRLDAWYTALASEEIAALRSDPARASGLQIGAYGVLEEITQSQRLPVTLSPGVYHDPQNGGFIHAPGVNQGAAAAVLRSAHLAHSAAGHGDAFSVDLSSARIRRALRLNEGIRAGQPLAALLGYDVERDLRTENLARLIAPLRKAAPLTGNQLTPSTRPTEAVAASQVIDGLKLLADAGYDGTRNAVVSTLWTAHPELGPALPQGEQDALARVFASAQDAIDAVSDLSLAESVYQAVQGNPVRTGATVDAVSGAPVFPAEFTIAQTPRSGLGITHRLVVLLSDDSAPASDWGNTIRAQTEPRLEAWARTILPQPTQIRLRGRFLDAGSVEVARLENVTLASLLSSATNTAPQLLLSGLDLVAQADPHAQPQRSALELRLCALLDSLRPADATDAALELVLERDPAWDATVFGLVETLEIAKGLRDLLGQTRAALPADFSAAGKVTEFATSPAELEARVTAAATALVAVETNLQGASTQTSSALRSRLFSAESFGIAGAAPLSFRDSSSAKTNAADLVQLRRQSAAVLVEIARRKALLAQAAPEDASAKVHAILGDSFLVLPTLIPADQLTGKFATAVAPAGASDRVARSWLGRAARVRENARKLDEVLGSAEAVAETQTQPQRQSLRIAQLGGAPGERWVGLPPIAGTALPGGRVSIVAVQPPLPATPALVAGLMIDEWVEVVPSAAETTSVSFHYDAPTSAPPQVLLLGVPYRTQETWTAADVLDVVDEALALSRIRMVDTPILPTLGQLLPAFVTPENSAAEVAGLDIETLTHPTPA